MRVEIGDNVFRINGMAKFFLIEYFYFFTISLCWIFLIV